MQECQVYLHVNRHVYTTDDAKVAFVLLYMNEKEALTWKENYLWKITDADGELKFPTIKDFLKEIANDFKLANKKKDTAHQITMLQQGKWMAEEVITEFWLLSNQAGYDCQQPRSSHQKTPNDSQPQSGKKGHASRWCAQNHWWVGNLSDSDWYQLSLDNGNGGKDRWRKKEHKAL